MNTDWRSRSTSTSNHSSSVHRELRHGDHSSRSTRDGADDADHIGEPLADAVHALPSLSGVASGGSSAAAITATSASATTDLLSAVTGASSLAAAAAMAGSKPSSGASASGPMLEPAAIVPLGTPSANGVAITDITGAMLEPVAIVPLGTQSANGVAITDVTGAMLEPVAIVPLGTPSANSVAITDITGAMLEPVAIVPLGTPSANGSAITDVTGAMLEPNATTPLDIAIAATGPTFVATYQVGDPMFDPNYQQDLLGGPVDFEVTSKLPENQPLASTMIGAAGGLQISLDWDASALAAPQSFRDGMQAAANLITAAFSDNITVHIKIGYGSINGTPLSNQTGALGGWNSGLGISYTNLRSELSQNATSADDISSVNALPNAANIQGVSSFAISRAQGKAFGLIDANNAGEDGVVGMGTSITGNNLISVGLHELTHAMGRLAGTGMDLVRFTANGTRLFSNAIPATASYFSVNDGATKLADFGITSDPGDYLNTGVQGPTDPFNEFYNGSTQTVLTGVDLRNMDVLGYSRADQTPADTVTITDVSVNEGNSGTSLMTFTVTRASGNTAFAINYATANGTATAGSDYVGTSGTLNFGTSTTSQTVSVTINGDTTVEPSETFFVNLSGATNGVTIADSQGLGTIINDDIVDDFTPDNTSTNGAITIGGSLTGTLGVAGDRDWFAINLTAGSAVTINERGIGGGGGTLDDSYLRLMNASGTEIAFDDDGGAGFDLQLVWSPATSGTYYIVAGSYNDSLTGTYTLSVAQTFTNGDDIFTAPRSGFSWDGLGGNDNLAGTSGSDTLIGNAGADYLDGAGGADQLVGGDGNDIFIVDNTGDTVTETNADVGTGGFDIVITTANFTLGANVEQLVMHGAATIGTGGSTDNVLYGIDSTQVLTLNGQGGNDVIYGSPVGGNTLIGGAGVDTLLAYGGNNNMQGGLGADIYYTYTASDILSEAGGDGIDTVYSNHDITLGDGFEQIILFGSATSAISTSTVDNNIIYGNSTTGPVTLSGGGGADVLFGGAFGDNISGGDGVDLLFGFGGSNVLAGGNDTDVYYLESGLDTITETLTGGFDTAYSQVAGSTTLAANVEQLILYGAATAGVGNSGDNYLYGHIASAAVTLDGQGGADYLLDSTFSGDILIGGSGNDQLDLRTGGNDFIRFAAGSGADVVYGFDADPTGGQDLIDLSGRGFSAGSIGSSILIGASGADTLVTIGADTIRLVGVLSTNVTSTDFQF